MPDTTEPIIIYEHTFEGNKSFEPKIKRLAVARITDGFEMDIGFRHYKARDEVVSAISRKHPDLKIQRLGNASEAGLFQPACKMDIPMAVIGSLELEQVKNVSGFLITHIGFAAAGEISEALDPYREKGATLERIKTPKK